MNSYVREVNHLLGSSGCPRTVEPNCRILKQLLEEALIGMAVDTYSIELDDQSGIPLIPRLVAVTQNRLPLPAAHIVATPATGR